MSHTELVHRPFCTRCGYQDIATFSRTQLDTYDFECPECGPHGTIQFRQEVVGKSSSVRGYSEKGKEPS